MIDDHEDDNLLSITYFDNDGDNNNIDNYEDDDHIMMM